MTEERGAGAPAPTGLWQKLRNGLARTQARLAERVGVALDLKPKLDEVTLTDLEEALIGADLGLGTVELLLGRLRERVRRADLGTEGRLRQLLAEEVELLLREGAAEAARAGTGGDEVGNFDGRPGPRLTLVVGVNGAGKTTSIAKLARRSQLRGEKVLLAAADTFRAAAIEQLVIWGERLGVEVVRQAAGSDPAAVVFDAIMAARARRVDHLIVDTAGRLHNKEHLMNELAKIRRIVEREAAGWPIRTLLVLDATTGQNALVQAREFLRVAAVDAVLLSKLDGTARGGMVVAVVRELKVPVLYLGVGEAPEDLVDFDPREFATALVS
ncbi:MAG: signal recognition particle-docking protein FtsY [Thermoanaerobaculia bacterium]|nr:signal recognition particle-docking protein FtsY [Thermoanaerobaculia bacterium]